MSDWKERLRHLPCTAKWNMYEGEQIEAFISDLLAKEKMELVERVQDGLVNAGYMIETIRGYIDAGEKEKADEHLAYLNGGLFDLVKALKSEIQEKEEEGKE